MVKRLKQKYTVPYHTFVTNKIIHVFNCFFWTYMDKIIYVKYKIIYFIYFILFYLINHFHPWHLEYYFLGFHLRWIAFPIMYWFSRSRMNHKHFLNLKVLSSKPRVFVVRIDLSLLLPFRIWISRGSQNLTRTSYGNTKN